MNEKLQSLYDRRSSRHQPTFSVIVALYNSEATVKATLDSFAAQSVDSSHVEYVIVNDGSEDRSLEIALNWAQGRDNVVILSKPNGGIASTRNAALGEARGTWLTSVDPDDIIERHYLEEVQKMILLDDSSRLALLCSRVLVTKHETGHYNTKHPLDKKFRAGNRFLDLRSEPNAFVIGATSFMRVRVLREEGLTFDERVAPSFEDGNLILRYLAHFDAPILGVVASAHYLYRKVSGGNSAVQGGWGKPEKYLEQVKWGYLGALKYVREQTDRTPDWIALAICYDLLYYFKEYHKYTSKTRWAGSEYGPAFLALCREIFQYISVDQLRLLKLNAPNWNLLQTLRIAFDPQGSPGRLFRWGERPDGLVNYTAMYRPGSGAIQVYSRGEPYAVNIEGQKAHSYFGEVLAEEISFALPKGDSSLFIDDLPSPTGGGTAPELSETPVPEDPWISGASKTAKLQAFHWGRYERILERIWAESSILERSRAWVLLEKLVRQIKRRPLPSAALDDGLKENIEKYLGTQEASRFEGCWYFIDHPDRADDNAEHLYRHVLHHHPEINAFFALERSSADWNRLEAEGFRLLEYGGLESSAAALSASVVLSSDAVEACMYPAPRKIFGTPDYKFVFLQHGVSDKDISAWLRGKKISLCVCATVDEFNAFSWKDSPYEFKVSQLALTGFPRHDSLLRKAETRKALPTDLPRASRLLIIPTWRRDLKEQLDAASSQEEANSLFMESTFGKAWWSLLENPILTEAIHDRRLEVDFLLHPNFKTGVEGLIAPQGVRLLRTGEQSFQDMLVNCDLFLTDYSSLVFDASYIGRPVAYYQFDARTLGTGTHSWTPGYFDYETMGLGPTYPEGDSVAHWVLRSLERNCTVEPVFEERVNATFVSRDSDNSERAVQSVKSLVAGSWPADREGLPERALPSQIGAKGWAALEIDMKGLATRPVLELSESDGARSLRG